MPTGVAALQDLGTDQKMLSYRRRYYILEPRTRMLRTISQSAQIAMTLASSTQFFRMVTARSCMIGAM